MRDRVIYRIYFESKEDRVIFYNILKKYNCSMMQLSKESCFSRSYLYNVLNGQKSVSEKLRLYLLDRFDYDIDLMRLFKLI